MGYQIINNIFKVIVLKGLLLYCCVVIQAQPAFLRPDSLNRPARIFHANLGYGVSPSKLGTSAWKDVDNTNNMGLSYALRWIRCFHKNSMGYGLYLWGYQDHGEHSLLQKSSLNERVGIIYVAPQFTYLRKETAFPNVFGLINLGMGYLSYINNSDFEGGNTYRTQCNSFGINIDIGCEYAFHRNWGVKLEVGGIFSPIRPKINSSNEYYPLQPRKRINLFMAFLQLGISTYL